MLTLLEGSEGTTYLSKRRYSSKVANDPANNGDP